MACATSYVRRTTDRETILPARLLLPMIHDVMIRAMWVARVVRVYSISWDSLSSFSCPVTLFDMGLGLHAACRRWIPAVSTFVVILCFSNISTTEQQVGKGEARPSGVLDDVVRCIRASSHLVLDRSMAGIVTPAASRALGSPLGCFPCFAHITLCASGNRAWTRGI
jgi:hypothetical protein